MSSIEHFAEQLPEILQRSIMGLKNVVVNIEENKDFKKRLGIGHDLKGLPDNCINIRMTGYFEPYDKVFQIDQIVSKNFLGDAMFYISNFLIYKYQDMILDLVEESIDESTTPRSNS
jgi:hypothetical protein